MLYTRKPTYIGFVLVSRGSTHTIQASYNGLFVHYISMNFTEIGNSKERVYINDNCVSNIYFHPTSLQVPTDIFIVN